MSETRRVWNYLERKLNITDLVRVKMGKLCRFLP
jgi:hypothetical protein